MPKRKHSDHRADTRGGALSGLPHAVSDSPSYLDLTPFERAVFAEILRRFNGYNNGTIGITYEEIGERLKGRNRCRPNNGRIARAVASLIEHGFLAEPTPESWIQRRAREYRITFITSGNAPPYRLATNEYLRWRPKEKKDGNAASPEIPQSGNAASPEANNAGNGQSPELAKNGSFACTDQISPGDAESLLIVKPYPAPKKGRRASAVPPTQIVNGPVAGLDGADAVQAIRAKVTAQWKKLRTAARRRSWAAAHGVDVEALRAYVIADPSAIPFPKQAALASAIRAERRAA